MDVNEQGNLTMYANWNMIGDYIPQPPISDLPNENFLIF